MPRNLATARSLLFVPGTRPERFNRAAGSGADNIIIDLEDAVAPADKARARLEVESWLDSGARPVVRINGRETLWHQDDLAMVAEHECPVMLPKVESAADVESVRRELSREAELIVLLESARAVVNAVDICCSPGIVRVAFGSFDLGAELGVDPDNYDAVLHARSAIVLACAAGGIAAPLDGVTGGVDDPAALVADIRRSRELGFSGKLCIHPRQVEHVNNEFHPSGEEILWAEKVLNAAGSEGVVVVDGKMIDAPVIARARRIATAAE